ncbi:MAG: DUF1460 domain-containing protein [Deltaproteobacteria bacterium]|nr:DUF1460 domain-containing protein [Deltaproteobacteria bacterium]
MLAVPVICAVAGVWIGAAAPAAHSYDPPDDAALELLIAAAQAEPDLGRRVELVSRRFLDAPYRLSPLGEGAGPSPDPDPRFTVAAFDCTTFVETVLALSLAPDLASAHALLDRIRYRDGSAEFGRRNHFPMAQWVPNNIRAGFLVDVTRRIGGERTALASKRLGPDVWQKSRAKNLPPLTPEMIPVGTFELPVIPIAAVPEVADRIPAGSVLSIVRADYRSIPFRVTHQGVVVRRQGRTYLRHAGRAGFQRVVDEPLLRHLERAAAYLKWPVTGVNLLQPQVPRDLDAMLGRAASAPQ